MSNLINSFLLLRVLSKVKGLTIKQIYELSVNMKERVYSFSVLTLIGIFSTVNYALTVGISNLALFTLLGLLLVLLLLGFYYHLKLYWILKEYILFMLRPIGSDLESPEIYFKRLLSAEVDLPKTENKND